ncbi:pilus assembly protein TadG-related protein [Raineyella fluvialis]|uniref:Putative Flp pilus-assembly TadG-like N-terminal domain-containing protein n=1 Tax=Raineyella fluvialis TaxID=2662261 RepID=A0A5Q2FI06_9ACTN|nr:TadE/TadG family type IV pilus assembly protein [Raineyella fluvialis]QGF24295.1 hypothetical protein Rai3103_12200 [Raineyella fluvialis]
MRWLRGQASDRGATAILVAITMVVLASFTALAIDGGALWSDKKQLQNGADAGSLAIAQSCAKGDCGAYTTTADEYAKANKLDANAAGEVTTLDTSAGTVTVRDFSTRSLWFAPVLGINTADVAAAATAKWRTMTSGTVLPLALSLCSFYQQSGTVMGDPGESGTEMVLYYKTSSSATTAITSDNASTMCVPPANMAANDVSGGFGWLGVDPITCEAAVSAGGTVPVSPGLAPPSCFDPTKLQNAIVQVPVFSDCNRATTGVDKGQCTNGNNGKYQIYGLASFLVTGYCFSPNTEEWNVGGNCTSAKDSPQGPRIVGKFVGFASLDSSSTNPPGPDMGTDQVALIQ